MPEVTLGFIPTVEDMGRAIDATRQLMDEDEDFAHELREGHTSGNPMTLGPRLPSVEDWTDDQIKGAKDNADKWLRNTTRPKKNFKEEALKATSRERFHDSMEAVLRENLWEGGMELVDEAETIATIEKRGAGVYSRGIEDRRPKIRRRVAELREDRLALAATVDGMPVATDADREAKMIANVRGLKAIGARRRGSS